MYACISHTVIGRAGGEYSVAHDAALHQLVGVARLRDADAVDGELTTRPIVGRHLRRHQTVPKGVGVLHVCTASTRRTT